MKKVSDLIGLPAQASAAIATPSRTTSKKASLREQTARLLFELDLMFPGRLTINAESLRYWQAALEDARLTPAQVESVPGKIRASGAEHPPSVPAVIAMARPPRRINAAAYRAEPLALPSPSTPEVGNAALTKLKSMLGAKR